MVTISRAAAGMAVLALAPLLLLHIESTLGIAAPAPRDSTIKEEPPPPPPEATAEEIQALRLRLREAVNRRHAEGLMEAAEALAAQPDDRELSWLARYYEGLAWYRLGELLSDRDETKLSRKAFDRAVDRLDDAVDANPKSADALALLGAAHAAQYGSASWKRSVWRPRAERSLARAAELDPSNPRLWLLRGKLAYRTAGDDEKERAQAIKRLERAAELFELAEEPAPPLPSWGHDEAWGWLAVIYMEMGELADARIALEMAGFANPESLWISIELQERLAEKIASDVGE